MDLGKIGIGIAMAVVFGIVVFITLLNLLSADANDEITWVG